MARIFGMEQKWDRKSCTHLAVGVAVCAMSYFNAYGFALSSVVMFVGSLIVFYRKKGAKICTGIILKRGLYITAVVFLLCGWWFIRCAILYDGDFLGLHAPEKYGELYAQEEFKPSVKKSLEEQGTPIDEMLRSEDTGGMDWIRTTYRSTMGYFGYLKYPLGLDIYEIPKRLVLLAHGWLCALPAAGSREAGVESGRPVDEKRKSTGIFYHSRNEIARGKLLSVADFVWLLYHNTDIAVTCVFLYR